MKVAFYDAKAYDRPSFEYYGGQQDIQFRFLETKLNEDTVDLARGCDAVCVFVNDTVNAAVIDKLYEYGVKIIALRSAGYNNVDIRHAFGKTHVVHVPAYSPYAVAEHAIALLLTSVRRIHKAYNRTREFNFSLNGLTGFDFHGKTVGVVGTGKIGRIFIDICRGFGMKVIAYDLFPAKDSGIDYVALDELLEQSDIISLHCPLTDETRHMINAAAIEKMKKGVVLVNTSRGGLIDAEALLEGIKARKIGAACLDVYEEEADVFFEDRSGHIMDDELLSRLISMPNVIVTSHQAFLTEEALNNIAETTVNNILSCFRNDGVCDNELCYRCGSIEQCRKERKQKCF
ncbi:2-hydroxyacid dehydrogenase [Clostridiales bacterium FE2011]|nr:2-hydroxyacid dehydrogenase [Clostridiales bacterium FE2011]QTE75875.1 2-hydroxyacid dehydrogenase [Clostridiales bacterium FE2010]